MLELRNSTVDWTDFQLTHEGLLALIDKNIRSLQEDIIYSVSNEVQSKDDLIKLFKSQLFSKKNRAGFQASMVFIIGLLKEMRPSELANLTVKQFRNVKLGYFLYGR